MAKVEELTAERQLSSALLEVHPDDRLADVAVKMLEHGATTRWSSIPTRIVRSA